MQNERCALCGSARADLVCAGCRMTSYCCGRHQRDDLPKHAPECAEFRRLFSVGLELPLSQQTRAVVPGHKWGDPGFELKQFKYVKLLGLGGFGMTTLRRWNDGSGGTLAIKEMKFSHKKALVGTQLHEFDIRSFDHPNVIGACLAGISEADKKLAIGMDAAAANLYTMIRDARAERRDAAAAAAAGGPDAGPFDPLEAQMISYQLLRGLAHITSRLGIHGDVKLGNVLAFGMSEPAIPGRPEAGNFKRIALIDFGMAKAFYVGPYPETVMFTVGYRPPELCGTTAAPEEHTVTDRADVWAAGCCMYEIATGSEHPLFDRPEDSGKTPLMRIVDVVGSPRKPAPWWGAGKPAVPSRFDGAVASGLREHPMLADLLHHMLAPLPEDRISVFEALKHPYFSGAAKARVEALLPERAPSPPLVHANPSSLAVSPASVLPVLREKARAEAEREARAWQPRPTLAGPLRCAVGRLIKHSVRGLGDLETATDAAALLRAYFVATPKGEVKERDFKSVAAACHVLAYRYRDALSTFKEKNSQRLCGVPRLALVKAALDALAVLDFNVALPSAYDFIRQYSITDGAPASAAPQAAALFLCRQMVTFWPPGKFDLEAEAARCLAFVTNKPAIGAIEMPPEWREQTAAVIRRAIETEAIKEARKDPRPIPIKVALDAIAALV